MLLARRLPLRVRPRLPLSSSRFVSFRTGANRAGTRAVFSGRDVGALLAVVGVLVGGVGLSKAVAKTSWFDNKEEKSKVNKENKDKEKPELPVDPKPSGKVKVPLDQAILASLPVVSLDEVRRCDGLKGDKLLVSYNGVVYDVSAFADHHPGGRDLLLTAAGLDLDHFFENYLVHAQSDKAANFLQGMAVGRLSEADAARSKVETTPLVHVEKRGKIIARARRRVLLISATLPFWLLVRTTVRFIGFFVPPLARFLAYCLPVTVPGYSRGANRLQPTNKQGEKVSVAVIGGGVAGCGAAWALKKDGFEVVLYEARKEVSGNARTFDWGFEGTPNWVKSCVSVTAWPAHWYKNYTELLQHLNIATMPMPLSWFINSKVPGYEGSLWCADPDKSDPASLRKVFEKDFDRYDRVIRFVKATSSFMQLKWAPWKWGDSDSMYTSHTGLGLLNPLNVVPLHALFKACGGSEEWWDVVFTPHYTASFLTDELRPFPAVFGPLIEGQIPLLPNPSNSWQGKSQLSDKDCHLTTCVTWKDAGNGIREVFGKLVEGVDLRQNTRVREVQVLPNGKKRVFDEFDKYVDVDRVIFACPSNAVGNMLKTQAGALANAILSTPVYADDHHPATGHMHAVMHSDGGVIDPEFREACLSRASNYVEVTRNKDGTINIENQYNFGVQTPGTTRQVYSLPLTDKPVMLISHALGEGKTIQPSKVHGTGNHVRAHPLYSGWNVAAQLSLRLVQGRDGVFYCSNWTTPGNCHDMSLLSGFCAAHAVGARYPFPHNREAKKDFERLRDLMGL